MAGRKPLYRSNGRLDYRAGIYAVEKPMGPQPRLGGPPLLFTTDARMTLLVTLALSGRPVRPVSLWRTLGRKQKETLALLVRSGVVAAWSLSVSKRFVALDPAHPAAAELRALLFEVARVYPGYRAVPYDPADGDGGDVPVRPRRRRDVRYTFGEPMSTLSLLIAHILGETTARRVTQAVPYFNTQTVRFVFQKWEAFGICKRRLRAGGWPRYEYLLSLDFDHPLGPYLDNVLAALDRAMPQWRLIAESQAKTVPPPPQKRKKRYRWHKPTGLRGWAD